MNALASTLGLALACAAAAPLTTSDPAPRLEPAPESIDGWAATLLRVWERPQLEVREDAAIPHPRSGGGLGTRRDATPMRLHRARRSKS